MLHLSDLHAYQDRSVSHIVDSDSAMLFLEPGLGKTICTLSAIVELRDRLQVYGTLIVAPLRVVQSVWRQESLGWWHTKGLTFQMIHGTKREREQQLFRKADVYLTNYENLVWLQEELEYRYLGKGKYLPFNMVVFDEISKMKNARVRQGAKRGQAVLKLLPFIKRRVGLTGTPASNGLLDLFGQYLVVDAGQRLGTSFEGYKQSYFYQSDYAGYRYAPLPGSEDAIRDVIGDITISMKAEDYLDMPPLVVKDHYVDLDPKLRSRYDQIEKDMMVELESGHQVEVFNEASLTNRCLQFANGGIYKVPGEPEWESIHDIKLDALGDIVEEAAGEPVLVAYQYQHDAHKILKKFPDAIWINSKMPEKEFNQAIADWVDGNLNMIIGHPASMGHGIDRLQKRGNIVVWYGLNWSLELYSQTVGRLHRQGQERRVSNIRILMRDTLDDVVREALIRKETDELSIKQSIKEYWDNKS
jgi:SNF2 family DNA or RNA helicase